MIEQLGIAAIGLLSTIISSFGVYWFTRRKYRAEAKNSELDNIEKAIGIWRNLATELKEQQTELEKQIEALREKIRVIEEGFQKKCESCKYRKFYYDHKTVG